ncbi:MAG: hypothetical protein IIA92_00415 [Chloroflexi bacterium]|nr:hypothetical protein [Chloroflexota bacterium]
METVFLGLGTGFAALALAMIVAIMRVEGRVRYRKVDPAGMEQWFIDKMRRWSEAAEVATQDTKYDIDVAWSIDAVPSIHALKKAIDFKPGEVKLRLAVGPRSEITDSIERELEAIQEKEGVTVKTVPCRPTPAYAIFGDEAALWYEVFSNGDGQNRKYGTVDRKCKAVRKLRDHFNQAWQPVFVGSGEVGDSRDAENT